MSCLVITRLMLLTSLRLCTQMSEAPKKRQAMSQYNNKYLQNKSLLVSIKFSLQKQQQLKDLENNILVSLSYLKNTVELGYNELGYNKTVDNKDFLKVCFSSIYLSKSTILKTVKKSLNSAITRYSFSGTLHMRLIFYHFRNETDDI